MMFRSNKGFTLVELLIVLVLIGLSSAIVLPNMWQQFDQVKYRSEVSKLKSMINFCRHYSYFQGQSLSVELKGKLLVVSNSNSGNTLRTLHFDTFTFSENILLFKKEGSLTKVSLFLLRENENRQIELSV